MVRAGKHFSWLNRTLISFFAVVDCGDYVVVSNARNVKVTGRKAEQIVYRHHTMFPGGLKEIKYKDMMQRKPDEVRPYFLRFHTFSHITS